MRTSLPPFGIASVLAVAILTALPLTPASSSAQILASERARVMQVIDGTEITIDYYRPRTRGRAKLFGHESVVWEHVWTPGANWSTALTLDRPITLDGVAVPEGDWSIWMRMSDDAFMPVELILDPEPRHFHTQPPAPHEGQIRLPMTLEDGAPFVDVLTWNFEELRRDGGTLAMRWGTHRAAFDVGVEPSMRMHATAAEAAPVTGMYELLPPEGTELPPGMEMPVVTMEITWDEASGWLSADIEGVPGPEGEFINSVDLKLLPFAEGIFMPGEYYDGAMQNTWEAFMEFDYDESGAVVGFRIRDQWTDEVMMTGRRTG